MTKYLIEFTYNTSTDESVEIVAENEKEAIEQLHDKWSDGEISIEAIMTEEQFNKAIFKEEN